MLPIYQLLARFKNLTNTEKAKKEAIVEMLKKNNIPSTFQQIFILKNTVFVKTAPIIKTELLLKKETLLAQIQKISTLTNISNIQ